MNASSATWAPNSVVVSLVLSAAHSTSDGVTAAMMPARRATSDENSRAAMSAVSAAVQPPMSPFTSFGTICRWPTTE